MCIIITKPAGYSLSRETVERAWTSNPHGAGVMWADEGRVRIEKGFMEKKDFMEGYDTLAAFLHEKVAVYHFRIATHGTIKKDLCHPFRVNPELCFAHNGILDIEVPKEKDVSDTAWFRTSVLTKLPRDFLHQNHLVYLLEQSLGYANKMAFLDATGQVTILNEHQGEWDSHGCWHSNTGALRSSWVKSPSRHGGYLWEHDSWDEGNGNYKGYDGRSSDPQQRSSMEETQSLPKSSGTTSEDEEDDLAEDEEYIDLPDHLDACPECDKIFEGPFHGMDGADELYSCGDHEGLKPRRVCPECQAIIDPNNFSEICKDCWDKWMAENNAPKGVCHDIQIHD